MSSETTHKPAAIDVLCLAVLLGGCVGVLLCGCGESDSGTPDDDDGGEVDGAVAGNGGEDAGDYGTDAIDGAVDGTGAQDAAVADEAGGPHDINQGFIGGSCDRDDDCDYSGGFCFTEDQSFGGGMCSLDCTRYCPDQYGAVTTFCVEPSELGTTADDGLCTIHCDYGQSPTGCRAGYGCRAIERFGEPDTVVYACLPDIDDPFPLGSCHLELLDRGIAFTPAINPQESRDDYPELICDVEDPVWIYPVLHGVTFRPESMDNEPTDAFTACSHALAMDRAAEIATAWDITDIVYFGIYDCRAVADTDVLSEHAYARAIDIAAVGLSSGETYTVFDDWELGEPDPATPGGALLYDFIHSVFDDHVYNVVLTPDYNEDHADHFHCDLTPDAHFLE